MKCFSFIFALYIVVLALTPCQDGYGHCSQSGQTAQHDCNSPSGHHDATHHDASHHDANQHDGDGHSHHHGVCSPFCVCSCCGCHGVYIPYCKPSTPVCIVVNEPQTPVNALFLSDFYDNIWEPPKA